ncbi:MAG: PAS domain-containing protein [Myxococcota bacterium]
MRRFSIIKELSSNLCDIFFESTGDLMLHLDADGTILNCNGAFCRTFGFKKEEVIGKKCYSVVHKTEFYIEECPLKRSKVSRQREEMEMKIGDRFFRVTTEPIFNKDGEISGFAHIATDITSYKSLINRLEESEFRFKELFNNSKDGQLIMTDIFIDANERMAEIFKCKISDIINKRPSDFSPLFQPDGSRSYEKSNTLINMALSGVEQEFYWQHIDINGNPIDTIVHLKKIKIKEKDLLLATVRDISEQLFYEKIKRMLNEKINLLQKAESYQNVIPGIVHDLNNSLMAASGTLDLITDRTLLEKDIFRQLKSSIEKAYRFSESLINIVTGRGEEALSVEINSLILDMVKWVHPRQRHNIKITFQSERDKIFILGFELKLQQIVMNLLINSIEAIGNRDGEIKVTTGYKFYSKDELRKNLTQTELLEGEFIFIRVEDNGCGMSEETLKKMFEPFFTTKSYGKGLGMLSIKNAVEAHRGGILVHSIEQRGTTFEIILPQRDKTNYRVESPEVEETFERDNKLIVIIDSDELVRITANRLITSLSLNAITTSNNKEAIDFIQKNSNNVFAVIIDIELAKENDSAIINEITEINDKIKIILSSGYYDSLFFSKLAHKKNISFIPKPYNITELKKLLFEK